MAPSWGTGDSMITYTGYETYASDSYYVGQYRTKNYHKVVKKETKKERTIRISKEKMLASRMVFNQKSMSIIQVKQFAKPRHRINIGKR